MDVNIGKRQTITNQSADEGVELDVDKKMVLELLQAKIYTNKLIYAQEIPSNGRDAIRRLQSMPQHLVEDLAVVRGIMAGGDVIDVVTHELKYGIEDKKGHKKKEALAAAVAEYEPVKGLSRAEQEELVARLEQVLARTQAVLKDHQPEIVFDLSAPDKVRVIDNGCGMTRDVVEKIFGTYGRSTKRDRKGSGETGGFGIGAKSPFALGIDSFFITTRSVETDETLHVVVTKERVNASVAKKQLPFFGTIVEIPLVEVAKRADSEKMVRQKTAYWTERVLVRFGPKDQHVVSQQPKIWETGDGVVCRASGPGWNAAVLDWREEIPSQSPLEGTEDVIVVDGIPFHVSQSSSPGFRTVIALEDPTLVRLPATRESVEVGEECDRLMSQVRRAVRKAASARFDEIVASIEAMSMVEVNKPAVNQLRGTLKTLRYLNREGPPPTQWNKSSPHEDYYAYDREDQGLGENEPKTILTRRAGEYFEKCITGGSATWYERLPTELRPQLPTEDRYDWGRFRENLSQATFRAILAGRFVLTPEECAMAKFLAGDMGTLIPKGHHEGSEDFVAHVTVSNNRLSRRWAVPSWFKLAEQDVDHYRATHADVSGGDEEAPIEWDQLTNPAFEPIFSPNWHGQVKYLVCSANAPASRTSAFRRILGLRAAHQVTFEPDTLRDLGELGAKSIVLVRASTWPPTLRSCRPFVWISKLPRDPLVQRSAGSKGPVSRSDRFRILERRWGELGTKTMQLAELIAESRKGAKLYLLKAEQEEMASQLLSCGASECETILGDVGEQGFYNKKTLRFLRSPISEERIEMMEEAGLEIESWGDLVNDLEEATIRILEKQGAMLNPRIMTMGELRQMTKVVEFDSATFDDAVEELTKHDATAWFPRVADGVAFVPDFCFAALRALASAKPAAEDAPDGPEGEALREHVLGQLSDRRQQLKIRSSLSHLFEYWRTVEPETPWSDLEVEFLVRGSQRGVVSSFDGRIEVIEARKVPDDEREQQAKEKKSAD